MNTRKFHLNKVAKTTLFCLIIFAILIQIINPIRNTLFKSLLLLTIAALWFSFLWITWKKKPARYIFLTLTTTFVLFCCMPYRSPDPNALRKHYVNSLKRYDSVIYMWGAETFLAIDCSGLVRQGFIDAMFIYSLKTFNGGLFREAFCLWWFDASAKAMRDGYQDRTKRHLKAPSINQLDHAQILPGDFAVTTNGVHCLAYLGNEQWIQADPTPNEVTINTIPEENSSWLKQPVYVIRWSILEKQAPVNLN